MADDMRRDLAGTQIVILAVTTREAQEAFDAFPAEDAALLGSRTPADEADEALSAFPPEDLIQPPASRWRLRQPLAAAAGIVLGIVGLATYFAGERRDVVPVPGTVALSPAAPLRAGSKQELAAPAATALAITDSTLEARPASAPGASEPLMTRDSSVRAVTAASASALDTFKVQQAPRLRIPVASSPRLAEAAVEEPAKPVSAVSPANTDSMPASATGTPSLATQFPAPPPALPMPAPAIVTGSLPETARPVTALLRAPAAKDDNSAIEATLGRYRLAFAELSSGAAATVWPTVDRKALDRAFNQLREQEFRFDSCDISVAGVTADAACVGQARYVPKFGSRTSRVESRRWGFRLRKAPDAAWVIERVSSS